MTKVIFHVIWYHEQHTELREAGGRGGQHSKLEHLSSQVTVRNDGVLLSWGCKAVNEFLTLLCLCMLISLYLSDSLAFPTGGMSEQLCGDFQLGSNHDTRPAPISSLLA